MTDNRTRIHRRAVAARTGGKLFLTILIWASGIIMFMPFLWMISASFKGENDIFTFPIEWIPANPTLHGYELLFNGTVSFVTYYLNSIKIAVLFTHDTICYQLYEA